MKIKSIRQTILLGVNAVVIVLLITTGFITYSTAHHEMDEIFDAQLAQYARMIDQFISHAPPISKDKLPVVVGFPLIPDDDIERTSAEERRPEGHKYEEKLVFQVWSADKKLILRSKNAETASLIEFKTGYHEILYNQRQWILYCVHNQASGNWIITGQRDDVRHELSLYLAFDQLIPLAISIIPVTILIWLSVNWGLRPIRELSRELATTKPAQLTPLNLQLPTELKPFQQAINQLLDDIENHFEKEKRFIANASHELRTPLSILLIHADNIKAAQNKDEIESAADAILISTRRLSHLVSQLMEMEKLDGKKNLQLTSINLHTLINEALSLINEQALHNVAWLIDVNQNTEIDGNFNLLLATFRNLLDNAAKYSPQHSEVKISATNLEDLVSITIANPIQADVLIDVERMGERFYRHPRNQKILGAGLGLSIVKKIITMHNGSITYNTTVDNMLLITIELKKPIKQ